MKFKVGDKVRVISLTNSKTEFGLNSLMEASVGKTFAIEAVNSYGHVTFESSTWHPKDLKFIEATDNNLSIPTCGNHHSAYANGEEEILTQKIKYMADYLAGLHNTDVFKRGKYKTQVYNGSGKLAFEQVPEYIMRKLKLNILQRKKVGFVKDKPDVIIMLDNSGSVAGEKLCNHMRVLSGGIADVFFADLNKIYLITFGHQGTFYEFDEKEQFVNTLLNETCFDEGSTRYDLAFMEALKNGCLQQDQTRPRLILLITDGVPTDLSNHVEGELNELREAGEFKKKGYREKYQDLLATATRKSTLIKSIDMVASLSALSNTVFRIYVLSSNNNKEKTFARIADEIASRMRHSKDYDETSKILIRRFINELLKNSLVFSFGDFMTGKLSHTVVEDIKNEMYKLTRGM